jgi:hypothetical protein
VATSSTDDPGISHGHFDFDIYYNVCNASKANSTRAPTTPTSTSTTTSSTSPASTCRTRA